MDLEPSINSILSGYSNDLWLRRRLELDEVIRHLEVHLDAQQADSDSSLVDFVRFIRLLRDECAGLCFSNDKQWCELMNLMQISKRLNHRSVKFKDILQNRRIIESNIDQIRNLNKSAKVGQTIETTLNDLESRIQDCHLNLPKLRANVNLELDITGGLSESRKLLREKCRLLQTLKNELGSSLIINDPRLTTWQSTSDKLEEQMKQINEIISQMLELEIRVSHLKPLIHRVNAPNRSLDNSLDSCCLTFKRCIDNRVQLVGKLYDLAKSDKLKTQARTSSKKSNRVSLYKLINPRYSYDRDTFGSTLRATLASLQECQQSLEEILQNLRLEFGRFYFINDLELLTVVSLDSTLVTDIESEENRNLISKIFSNAVDSFLIDNQQTHLVGVRSPFGESVHFNSEEYVAIQSRANAYQLNIVRIFNEMTRKLKRTLRRQLSESMSRHGHDEVDWSLPIQLLLLAEQMRFCSRVESYLDGEGSSRDLCMAAQFYKARLDELSSDLKGRELIESHKKSALLSLTVHFVLSLNELITSNVTTATDWNWLRRVRYYMVDGDNLEVRIANLRSPYRFNYLQMPIRDAGNQTSSYKRLIDTQITERCFLTASQAVLSLKLGANPYGPAGSGKTESIKALGHLLGCQVIVHNCDESNDCKSLERLVWGLSYSGLWGCFDEFNRLSASVLSSISATLELVQCKLRENISQVELPDGRHMRVDPDSAFFITFNPVDSSKSNNSNNKYRGRRRLPANLRHLFLPIAMVRVDFESIIRENILQISAESSLGSSALQPSEALDLAKIMANLITSMKKTIISENLSEGTCEWDLRLVMAILNRIKLQLASLPVDHSASQTKRRIDLEFMARAVKSEVEPRLAESSRARLLEQLSMMLSSPEECSIYPKALSKSEELDAQLQTRAGVLLLGPSQSGKTKSWMDLCAARSGKLEWLTINPKAHSHEELFGYVDSMSMKWSDGDFTKLVRRAHQFLQNDQTEEVWIILDGPIDPDWIESLNSVLDDNQLLTLTSGERLNFCANTGKKIKLIFETDSIEFASPATISRLGLVHYGSQMDEHEIQRPCSLELAREKVEDLSCKLLVLVGDTHISRKLISESKTSTQMTIYNCSQSTSAMHLRDIIENPLNQSQSCIVLHNIQLIEKDHWGVRSTLEYLRYLLTYSSSDLQCRFIVTADSCDQFCPRFISLSTLIDLKSSSNQALSGGEVYSNLCVINDIELTVVSQKSPIMSISSKVNGGHRRKRILDAHEARGNTVWQFNNTSCIDASLKELERATSVGSKGNVLFLLNDIEFRLMDAKRKSGLCHSLNKLITRPKVASFIYLCHSDMTTSEMQLWSSFGTIYQLESIETSVESRWKSIMNRLTEKKLGITIDTEWTENKFRTLIASFDESQLIDERIMQSFSDLFVSFFHKWSTRLQENQHTLHDSLERLKTFEQELEVAGQSIARNRSEVQSKEQTIQGLIKSLVEAQEEACLRKEEMKKTKREQVDKNNAIKTRSSRIEQELAVVSASVEQTKSDIMQHLNHEALNEIKSLRSPPKTIKDILDVLFVFLGEKDTSWSAVKTYLTKYSLKDKLYNFDFVNVDAKQLEQVEKLMNGPQGSSLDPQQAARASAAAVPIVKWIKTSLEYGKVMIRLKPLQNEMDKLAKESKQLEQYMSDIEGQKVAIDKKIDENSTELDRMRREQEKALAKLKSLQSLLATASKAHVDLKSQFDRWRRQLSSTDELLSGNKLIGLAMITSCLAVLHNPERHHEVMKWIELMELQPVAVDESQLIRLIVELDSDGAQLITDDNHNHELVSRLLILKLNLDHDVRRLPFIDMDDSTLDCGELGSILTSCQILLTDSEPSKQLVSIRHNEPNWQDSLNLAVGLNKLVLLSISLDTACKSRLLDVLQLCFETRANRSARILLIGQLKNCSAIEHLLRYIKLRNPESSAETAAKVAQELNRLLDPVLSNSMSELSAQILIKQSRAKLEERNLMRKLASKQELQTKHVEVPFDEDLLQILNRLHETSESSRLDQIRMEAVQRDLIRASEKCRDVAKAASLFYQNHVMTLHHMDPFYHCSLARFMRMLAEQVTEVGLDINLSSIASKLAQSMRPSDRLTYIRQLAKSDLMADSLGNIELTDSITKEMNELESPRLMIVAHEVSQTSPQTDIDELFRSKDRFKYHKIYATGEEYCKQLDDCLRVLLVADSREDKRSNCLCVLNAHLSGSWINRNLVGILRSATDCKLLVILVGEVEVSGLFDWHVYEFASVRWWYDELTLRASTRFTRYLGRLSQWKGLESSNGHLLARQLTLLHVVCQERVKEKRWTKDGYSFDSDQFRLAMRVLDQIVTNKTGVEDANLLFRRLLDRTIYGSRMETLDDERTLCWLIDRCFAIDDPQLVETVCIESADDPGADLIGGEAVIKAHDERQATKDKQIRRRLWRDLVGTDNKQLAATDG